MRSELVSDVSAVAGYRRPAGLRPGGDTHHAEGGSAR